MRTDVWADPDARRKGQGSADTIQLRGPDRRSIFSRLFADAGVSVAGPDHL